LKGRIYSGGKTRLRVRRNDKSKAGLRKDGGVVGKIWSEIGIERSLK
jgi:hypothetical protein